MTNASENLKLKEEQRYAVLKYMYTAVTEEQLPKNLLFTASSMALILSYAESEIESALRYLEGEQLIEYRQTMLNGQKRYWLAHSGIKEIERSFQALDEAAEPFSTRTIQHFYGPVGTVQAGVHAKADVTQNIGVDFSDVLSLIEQMKSQVTELPQEQRGSASDSVEILEEELKSQAKNPERVKRSLERLGRMARGTVTFSSQVASLAQQLKDLNLF